MPRCVRPDAGNRELAIVTPRDSIASSALALASLIGKRSIVIAIYPADCGGGVSTDELEAAWQR